MEKVMSTTTPRIGRPHVLSMCIMLNALRESSSLASSEKVLRKHTGLSCGGKNQ